MGELLGPGAMDGVDKGGILKVKVVGMCADGREQKRASYAPNLRSAR